MNAAKTKVLRDVDGLLAITTRPVGIAFAIERVQRAAALATAADDAETWRDLDHALGDAGELYRAAGNATAADAFRMLSIRAQFAM